MDFEEYPLNVELDHEILMHRDAHFGGKFDVMIEYYESGGKGVQTDFEIPQIYNLAKYEQEIGENLAGVMLTGPEAEQVSKSKELYKQLRDLYENPEMQGSPSLLIADLILSEKEDPEAEIHAIAEKESAMVPVLINLLRSEDFFDPLYPGYGHAPVHAAKCLGMIGDQRAIMALFETIHERDFFDEDVIFDALRMIGAPAKEFLLQVVKAKPFSNDNERAAIALIQFKDDEEIAKCCLNMLKDLELRQKHLSLAVYLALACEGLKNEELRNEFRELIEDPSTPEELKSEMQPIANSWAY